MLPPNGLLASALIHRQSHIAVVTVSALTVKNAGVCTGYSSNW